MNAVEEPRDGADGSDGLQSPFTLLAGAIAGRPLSVLEHPAGDATYTDGHTIFLEQAGTDDDKRIRVVIQAALVGAGSLTPGCVKQLRGSPRAAERYLFLEAHRALRVLSSVLPRFATSYPGLQFALAATESAEESLVVAQGRHLLPPAPPSFGALRPRRVLKAEDSEGGRPTKQDLAGKSARVPPPELEEDEESEEVKILRAFNSPLGSVGVGRLLQKIFGLGREPGSGPGGPELGMGGARPAAHGGRNALSLSKELGLSGGGVKVRVAGSVYPEWDTYTKRYRPAWCTVAETVPPAVEKKPLEWPRRNHEVMVRRQLGQLGLELDWNRRQIEGDELDVGGIVALRVDIHARCSPDERVYRAMLRSRRDLGVLVLLDVSDSLADNASAGRRVHDLQVAATFLLAETLAGIGARLAVYGFRSRGRSAVRLLRVKGFDDHFDRIAVQRLAALEPLALTRIGAAIRHATHLIERGAGTTHRLLVLVSDGFPYDEQYEGQYAEADTRRALQEALRLDIGVCCIGVGSARDEEALRRVFGGAPHANVRNLDELAWRIGPLVRSAMGKKGGRKRGGRGSVGTLSARWPSSEGVGGLSG